MDKNQKILIVEDEMFLLRALKDKLTNEGYTVHTSENGKDGLEKTQSEKPDLVILDLVMPIKNGFSYLEDKAKDPKIKDIPVIVLSNLGQDSDLKKARELGAINFLIKANFSLREIVKKIEFHLPS